MSAFRGFVLFILFFGFLGCGYLRPRSQGDSETGRGFRSETMAYKNTYDRTGGKDRKESKDRKGRDGSFRKGEEGKSNSWRIADSELQIERGKSLFPKSKPTTLKQRMKKDRRWQARSISGKKMPKNEVLTQKDVRSTILNNLEEVKYCYHQANKRVRKKNKTNEKISGQLILNFDIHDNGQISEVKTAKNTTRSRTLQRCLEKRMQTWDFPSAPKDQVARIRYPFIFGRKVSSRLKAMKQDRIYVE